MTRQPETTHTYGRKPSTMYTQYWEHTDGTVQVWSDPRSAWLPSRASLGKPCYTRVKPTVVSTGIKFTGYTLHCRTQNSKAVLLEIKVPASITVWYELRGGVFVKSPDFARAKRISQYRHYTTLPVPVQLGHPLRMACFDVYKARELEYSPTATACQERPMLPVDLDLTSIEQRVMKGHSILEPTTSRQFSTPWMHTTARTKSITESKQPMTMSAKQLEEKLNPTPVTPAAPEFDPASQLMKLQVEKDVLEAAITSIDELQKQMVSSTGIDTSVGIRGASVILDDKFAKRHASLIRDQKKAHFEAFDNVCKTITKVSALLVPHVK